MKCKKPGAFLFAALFVIVLVTAGQAAPCAQTQDDQRKTPAVELIAADELKARLGRNEAVTIIDVRSTASYVRSRDRIKGAVFVKLRRLRSRLAFPPLKNVPRDALVVTYCACPNDESSIRAAQTLSEAGFKRVRVLKGGWHVWLKENGPVEPKPKNF
jgi:rhodanese-related sulfurtransferase